MTLIATFAIQECPILFGDLLLTGPTEDRKIVAGPAAGELQDFFGDSGWSVSGLCQKVNIISDQCALAWAGSFIGARHAMRELRRRFESGAVTYEQARDFLENDPDLLSLGTGFVGLFYEDGRLYRFHVRGELFPSPSFGDVFRCGTGSPAIDDFSDLMSQSSVKATGSVNPAAIAISHGLVLGGLMLNHEFREGNATTTIRNMFGGFYETAFFAAGKMRKIPEATYMFWEADVGAEEIKLSSPQLVLKQQYSGALLLLLSARMEATEASVRIIDEQRHVIRPLFDIDGKPGEQDFSQVSLYSPLFCHCVSVQKDGVMLGWYTRVQGAASKERAGFMFEDHGDKVIFSFKPNAVAELVTALQSFRSVHLP